MPLVRLGFEVPLVRSGFEVPLVRLGFEVPLVRSGVSGMYLVCIWIVSLKRLWSLGAFQLFRWMVLGGIFEGF